MKKYSYFFVAAIVLSSSCSTDDVVLGNDTQNESAKEFTVTIDNSAETRATLVGNTANWESSDVININGKIYVAQSDGPTTTFSAKIEGQEAQGPTYNAYFPSNLYDGTTAILPAEVSETWADGQFNMPMYASSNSTDLRFKNLCGVLKISVTSDQIAAVKRIRVSSANKAVSGVFTVDANNSAVLTDASTVANTLTITYTDAVPTDAAGTVFYVAVPAQIYQELKIDLDADGSAYTNSMITKSSTDITIARNTIYPITFAEKHIPVDLGLPSGLKWAACNIGATAPDEYGLFFAWGETKGYGRNPSDGRQFNWANYKWCDGTSNSITKYCADSSNGTVDGKTTLDSEDDAATANWGGTWRMPTRDEWVELLTNCTWTWTSINDVHGYLVTSTSNSNSIFLSDTGVRWDGYIGNGGSGYYWSSSFNIDTKASYLSLNQYSRTWGGTSEYARSRCDGLVVRAVCP